VPKTKDWARHMSLSAKNGSDGDFKMLEVEKLLLVSLCHFATKSMIFPIFYHIKDNNKGDNAVRL
jgi:hypothetical protein